MNDILKEIVKPALVKILELIDKNKYWDVYIIFIVTLICVIALILFLSWLLAQRKLKSEILKNSAEYKEKQIGNLEKCKIYRRKYLDNTILLQMATQDIIESFKSNDLTKLKSTIEEYRNIIFNDLIESFEEYIDIYEIMYHKETERFNSLFSDEFIPLINTINSIMFILNDKKILSKVDLMRYKIEKYVFRSIISYFDRNLSYIRIIKRIKCYFAIRKLLNQNGV